MGFATSMTDEERFADEVSLSIGRKATKEDIERYSKGKKPKKVKAKSNDPFKDVGLPDDTALLKDLEKIKKKAIKSAKVQDKPLVESAFNKQVTSAMADSPSTQHLAFENSLPRQGFGNVVRPLDERLTVGPEPMQRGLSAGDNQSLGFYSQEEGYDRALDTQRKFVQNDNMNEYLNESGGPYGTAGNEMPAQASGFNYTPDMYAANADKTYQDMMIPGGVNGNLPGGADPRSGLTPEHQATYDRLPESGRLAFANSMNASYGRGNQEQPSLTVPNAPGVGGSGAGYASSPGIMGFDVSIPESDASWQKAILGSDDKGVAQTMYNNFMGENDSLAYKGVNAITGGDVLNDDMSWDERMAALKAGTYDQDKKWNNAVADEFGSDSEPAPSITSAAKTPAAKAKAKTKTNPKTKKNSVEIAKNPYGQTSYVPKSKVARDMNNIINTTRTSPVIPPAAIPLDRRTAEGQKFISTGQQKLDAMNIMNADKNLDGYGYEW